MTPHKGIDDKPDQQRRIQTPDGPDERRLLAEHVGNSGDDVAIEIALEIIPKWIVGGQEVQDDDRTLR